MKSWGLRMVFLMVTTWGIINLHCGGNTNPVDGGGQDGTDLGENGNGIGTIVCEADKLIADSIVYDPGVINRVQGSNGRFQDECDSDGNLIQYNCETKMQCEGMPNPVCVTFQTGEVASTAIDCNGKCAVGTCDSRCPETSQKIEYLSLDTAGNAVIKNMADQRSYDCELTVTLGDYDCVNEPYPGATGRIASLGMQTTWCVYGPFGNIGVAIDGVDTGTKGHHCSYACSIAH